MYLRYGCALKLLSCSGKLSTVVVKLSHTNCSNLFSFQKSQKGLVKSQLSLTKTIYFEQRATRNRCNTEGIPILPVKSAKSYNDMKYFQTLLRDETGANF